jgi:hypothetical protein
MSVAAPSFVDYATWVKDTSPKVRIFCVAMHPYSHWGFQAKQSILGRRVVLMLSDRSLREGFLASVDPETGNVISVEVTVLLTLKRSSVPCRVAVPRTLLR